MSNREQDHFFHVSLSVFETTNIIPGYIGDSGLYFSEGRRISLLGSKDEVVISDIHGLKDFSINGVLVKVDDIHLFTHALHGGFLAEGGEIGSDTTVSLLSNS